MSNALIVGDIHIPNSKMSIVQSSSFYEVFQTLNFIREITYERKPDYVIFLGDVFDSPAGVSTPVISVISKLIAEIAQYTSVILINGNHDGIDSKISKMKIGDRYLNVRASLLTVFENFNNVTVFDSPKVVKISDGIEIGFIPYNNNVLEDIKKIHSRFSIGVKKIMMGHFDLLDSYHTVVKEDHMLNAPYAKDLITKYNYDLVLLGHIHDVVEYKINGKLVKYVGSCRNVDFRNTGENKGVYLLDFDTFDMEYFDNPHTSIYKIFNCFKDLREYYAENDKEKLSRTKIRYIYTTSDEVKELSKIKNVFKSLNFQKNLKAIELTTDKNVSGEALKEFEQMMHNDLITKENLIDFALSFNSPENKQAALDLLNVMISAKRMSVI